MNDKDARQYVNGTAFHLYTGPIEALSRVHNAYPDKSIYFTEQWVGAKSRFDENLAWHSKTLGSGLIWGDGVILGYGLYPALLRQVRQ